MKSNAAPKLPQADTASLFMNGRSQAVRLPKEYRFDCEQVYIRRQGDEVVLSAKPRCWDDFFEQKSAFTTDFLSDREDFPPQEREPF